MSAVAPSTRELARLDSAGKHAGLIKAHYPFWDSYFRPALLTAGPFAARHLRSPSPPFLLPPFESRSPSRVRRAPSRAW